MSGPDEKPRGSFFDALRDRSRVVTTEAGYHNAMAADLWHRPADPFVTRFVQAQRGPQVPA